jgi:hypothetical protein
MQINGSGCNLPQDGEREAIANRRNGDLPP